MKRTVLWTACALLALTLAAPAVSPAQTLAQSLSGCGTAAPTRTIRANPSNYKTLMVGLLPGDKVTLDPGTYTQGLRFWNVNGQVDRCIVVEGPASGSPALFLGTDLWNTVSFKNASYIAVKNLQLDGQRKLGDGVKVEVDSTYAHHIWIEGLQMKNYNNTVQTVGINTKAKAWNWVIRKNVIVGAGTGMYLGKSDGNGEFVNGLIENNLIYNTLGYGIQIKHQLSRDTAIGIPATAKTIIRHNVISKESGSLSGTEARPNLLVGHWPLSGAGAGDVYVIYGNVFWENPYEALFQGEGNIAFYDNLLVNKTGPFGMRIQKHNDLPRKIDIFNNTVLAKGTGIQITSGAVGYVQRVIGNAVFAATPLYGGVQTGNVVDTYANAAKYLNNPTAPLGTVDLYPKVGALQGALIDMTSLNFLLDYNRDFNLLTRVFDRRGAYAGEGVNAGWWPKLEVMPIEQ
ncbi:MAG TPA: right-handed parallel beta-helix repeat-containing protein [Thermoanaerobaculia bacterium]|nr:right-handed parallel beta-helix repeat-containing protein [Thermoanaerobaculia bacterium]